MKLISLNVGMSERLNHQLSFFSDEQPDVICLQETTNDGARRVANLLGMQIHYKTTWFRSPKAEDTGIAILTRSPVGKAHTFVYADCGSGGPSSQASCRALLAVELSALPGFHIATTHFTWSRGGRVTVKQRRDWTRLLSAVRKFEHVVLCGDFNTPRGSELREVMEREFIDCIPSRYTSSLDPRLHRARSVRLLVDGLYRRGLVRVSGVKLVGGVSDHRAIVGEVRLGG